jgi:hypothetical protein
MSDPTQNPKVQLGCGTLILIAVIVAVFSQCGLREELHSIQDRLDRIERALAPGSETGAGSDAAGPAGPEGTPRPGTTGDAEPPTGAPAADGGNR